MMSETSENKIFVRFYFTLYYLMLTLSRSTSRSGLVPHLRSYVREKRRLENEDTDRGMLFVGQNQNDKVLPNIFTLLFVSERVLHQGFAAGFLV